MASRLPSLRRARPEKGRRDLRRADHARRGAVALLVIALLLGAAYLRSSGEIGAPPQVSALVADAGGALRPGADVKMRGVIVGRVTAIERADAEEARDAGTTVGQAPVRLDLDIRSEDLGDIPDDVVARILPASVFGTTYVDLVRRGERGGTRTVAATDAPALRAGAVIPPDRSQGTLELQQALDDVDRLVKALGPARLSSALGAAATALNGRGARIGRILDRLDAYLTKVEPLVPRLRSDVRDLTTSLGVVERVAPDLLDATDDGLVTLRTVTEERDGLRRLLVGGARTSAGGRALLERNRVALAGALSDTARVLDAVDDNREAALRASNRINIALARLLPTAIVGGYVDVDGRFQNDTPPAYGPGDRPVYQGGAR
ncbi:MCE family protein [Nocardioides sp. TRM66260-LWL]|uniref:MCE family protein n=1 Tax=Nocardioides sp. TRM66260-LWL TaxID=2874478 RepID=UPI001CC6CE3A|nr:MCE family protein [Nocardioides sp. TRM66260-LWL]MBZ5736292.1 MCE family protein [Nocardioides sp. TRM66260-LWL]